MAQVTGGSTFDENWEARTNACLRLLRESADLAAEAAFPTSSRVVDAFLWVLTIRKRELRSFRDGRPFFPARFFDADAPRYPPAAESCAQLHGHDNEHRTEALNEIRVIVESAGLQWADGDPEDPSTRETLRRMLDVLWTRRLAPRPPSRQYPRGV